MYNLTPPPEHGSESSVCVRLSTLILVLQAARRPILNGHQRLMYYEDVKDNHPETTAIKSFGVKNEPKRQYT